MRKVPVGTLFFILLMLFSLPAGARESSSAPDREAIEPLRALQFVPGDSLLEDKVFYGDSRGYLYILQRQDKGFSEQWKSRHLGSGIMAVFVRDINADKELELLAYTSGGRIFIFNPRTHSLIWENNENEFSAITAMSLANLDRDPQEELIFCADSHLFIYDGKSLFEKWRSQAEFKAEEIMIGDVDGDGQMEIVLNTGWVLDARFRDVEWQCPDPFGDRMALLDIDDDGIPELIGEFGGHFLKVFDINLRREKW